MTEVLIFLIRLPYTPRRTFFLPFRALSLAALSLAPLSLGRLSLAPLSLGRLSLGRLSLGPLGRLSLGPLGPLSLGPLGPLSLGPLLGASLVFTGLGAASAAGFAVAAFLGSENYNLPSNCFIDLRGLYINFKLDPLRIPLLACFDLSLLNSFTTVSCSQRLRFLTVRPASRCQRLGDVPLKV